MLLDNKVILTLKESALELVCFLYLKAPTQRAPLFVTFNHSLEVLEAPLKT